MTSVRELAESDLKVTLSGNDFGMPFEIYDANLEVWVSVGLDGKTLKGQYHRIATIKNPQTNLRTFVNRSSLTVQNSIFPFEIKDGYLVKIRDINNNEVEGILKNVASDNTIGFTTWQIESVPNPNKAIIPARRGMKNAD